MNYRLVLRLMTLPAVAGSMLTPGFIAGVATATEAVQPAKTNLITPATSQSACDLPANSNRALSVMRHRDRGTLIASSTEIPGSYPVLDFSEAESDAAVTLFGCDCSSCIRALRQLQSHSFEDALQNKSRGHCWTSLQQRVSPQEMQTVLQKLEAEKIK